MRRSCCRWFALVVLISAVSSLPAAAQVVTSTVAAGLSPSAVAVNPVTNKVYVSTLCGDDPQCQSNGTVTAIDGAAGVGKSALAVHAAHRLRPSFPDGQLFLDLHGHTDGLAPLAA